MFVGGERDGFEKMQGLGKEVRGRLEAKGLLGRVEKEGGSQRYSLGALGLSFPPRRLSADHSIYLVLSRRTGYPWRSTLPLQVASVRPSHFASLRRRLRRGREQVPVRPLSNPSSFPKRPRTNCSGLRLITLYQRIHDALHLRPAFLGSARPPAKLVYLRTEHEAVLGWVSPAFLSLLRSPLNTNCRVFADDVVVRAVRRALAAAPQDGCCFCREGCVAVGQGAGDEVVFDQCTFVLSFRKHLVRRSSLVSRLLYRRPAEWTNG